MFVYRFIWTIHLLAFLLTALAFQSALGKEQIDFIDMVKSDTALSQSTGIGQLSASQLSSLNKLLNNVFWAGYSACEDASRSASEVASKQTPSQLRLKKDVAYESKIESDDDEIIRLENGAIVEISSGFLGYVGYRKNAILYRIGSNWKIWIQGKRAYRCEVIRLPEFGRSQEVEEASLAEVKGNGKILFLSDGRLFEVMDLFTIETQLWLGLSALLILDGFKVINLDEGGEVVEVLPLN